MHFQNSPCYAQELWVGLIYTYNLLTAVNVFVSSTWPKCWMWGELYQHCAGDTETRASSFSASKKQQLAVSEETVGRRVAESTCPCAAMGSALPSLPRGDLRAKPCKITPQPARLLCTRPPNFILHVCSSKRHTRSLDQQKYKNKCSQWNSDR